MGAIDFYKVLSAVDELFLFAWEGYKRTKHGVLNLHSYKGKGRPRKSDYVPAECLR